MKALILDGSISSDPTAKRVLSALKDELKARSWEIEPITLREKKIGNCAGDFFCWVRTPGMCVVNDDNRSIAQAVMRCDLLVYLTPVTFGGYSSVLKRAVDRLTQNNLPFFKEDGGEIHHQPRYAHNPKLLVIGWIEAPETNEETIFHTLVRRNAINMHYPIFVSGIIYEDQADEELAGAIGAWVKEVDSGVSSPAKELALAVTSQFSDQAVRRALLLVGSPKGKKSTSQALGGYLFDQLDNYGIQTETIHLYPALGTAEGRQSLLAAVDSHDLIVLASPLYIDCLPGPVTHALELIAAHCAEEPDQHAFTAIINSGFPEAKQNETALAICAAFTRRAGFIWAGGLALGGGAGVVNGTPLIKLGWRASSIRIALELAARSLAAGMPIPDNAIALMGKRRIPNWLLFGLSSISWKAQSRRYGAEKLLSQQPYRMD